MDERMPGFVVGHHLPFLLLENHGFALFAVADLVARGLKVFQRDLGDILLGTENRGLIDEVREVSAGHSRRGLGNNVEGLWSVRDRLAFAVSLENRTTAFHVRVGDVDLAVETAGPEKRVIEV